MSRSVKVRTEFISKVKAAVQRQGYARQKDLAEDLGLSLATVSNFLNGRPVDYLNFIEICDKLGLDLRAIAAPPEDNIIETLTIEAFRELPGELPEELIYIERPPFEEDFRRPLWIKDMGRIWFSLLVNKNWVGQIIVLLISSILRGGEPARSWGFPP